MSELEPGTYRITVHCLNCGWGKGPHIGKFAYPTREMEVPKGTTIRQFLHAKRCPRCGCQKLEGRG